MSVFVIGERVGRKLLPREGYTVNHIRWWRVERLRLCPLRWAFYRRVKALTSKDALRKVQVPTWIYGASAGHFRARRVAP